MTAVSVERIADTEGRTWGVRVSIGHDAYILTEAEATVLAAKLDAALGVDE